MLLELLRIAGNNTNPQSLNVSILDPHLWAQLLWLKRE